jgi:hypothetical protein
MSALGRKQTCAVQNGMSALPPTATAKADIRNRRHDATPPAFPRQADGIGPSLETITAHDSRFCDSSTALIGLRSSPSLSLSLSACNLLKVKRETGADRIKCYSVLFYADRKGYGGTNTARKD